MLPIVETTKGQRGFTLLELIVSLGLLGIILLSTFSLYGMGQKTYKKLQAQFDVQQNTRQAIMWLSTSIKHARLVDVISEDEIQITTGNRETINFYLDKGILYRRKNNGVNPIAELKSLKFIKSRDNTIEILLSGEWDKGRLKLRIKAVPLGVWLDNGSKIID